MGVRLSVRNATSGHRYTVFVDAAPLLIGRASTSDIRLPFAVVSSRHLRLGQDDDGKWTIEELGSTNGTMLNGAKLEPGPPTRLQSGDELEIGDVSVSFVDDAEQNSGDFTLAQTGTLARKLVADALAFDAGDDDAAFLEAVTGPSQGTRKVIEDDIDALIIGASAEAWLTLPDIDDEAAQIVRVGDGFAIQVFEEDEEPRPLTSKDRIELGEHALVFFDPLESALASTPAANSETVTAEPVVSDEDSSVSDDATQDSGGVDVDAPTKNGRALGTTEIVLMGFAALLAVAGLVIMLILFEFL